MAFPFPSRPFTRAELTALGISTPELRRAVVTGGVRRVLTGVYAPRDLPDTVELRVVAAALVVPAYAVVCDRTAAWLHGVDTLDYRELEILPPVEVVVPPDYRARRRAGLASGQRDLAADDVMTLQGMILATTPTRTALDLGCSLSRRQALATLDQFGRLHGLTALELEAHLPRFAGRRGVRQLRRLLALMEPRSESTGESLTRLAIIDTGLPCPVTQHSIRVDGVERYRLDLAYPHHRVCVEYDGQAHHSTSEQRAHDAERRRWLEEQGWRIIVVTKDDLAAESRARWLAELAEALRDRPRR